jgi:hypothetical protein
MKAGISDDIWIIEEVAGLLEPKPISEGLKMAF